MQDHVMDLDTIERTFLYPKGLGAWGYRLERVPARPDETVCDLLQPLLLTEGRKGGARAWEWQQWARDYLAGEPCARRMLTAGAVHHRVKKSAGWGDLRHKWILEHLLDAVWQLAAMATGREDAPTSLDAEVASFVNASMSRSYYRCTELAARMVNDIARGRPVPRQRPTFAVTKEENHGG